MLRVNFIEQQSEKNHNIAVLINSHLQLSDSILKLDQEYQNVISNTIADRNIFNGDFGNTKLITTIINSKLTNIILVGVGDESKLNEFKLETIGGKITSVANSNKISDITIITHNIADFNNSEISAFIGSGALLASYTFNKYKTKTDDSDNIKNTLNQINIIVHDVSATNIIFEEKQAIAHGVFLARDYISEPPNVLYPESYAKSIINNLSNLNIKVEVLDIQAMEKLGMGALLGVGQGSIKDSRLVIMQYNGHHDKNKSPIALVGKGVTFDSGGISIKPSANMWDMKYDMAGSAIVVGAIKALAARNAKVNVVGIVGLVENMPSGSAQRPSDVVKSMSGQTIEVLNTDAEGRLVLADALWYAQEKFNPECIIDIATLTGAIVVALGSTYAGCFSNDDNLAKQLIEAGDYVGEKLWRMPLHEDYNKTLKSDIADVANISNKPGAGSATAACFLSRFIKQDIKWAHLDIAGVAWENKGQAICPRKATGYGVRLFNKFIKNHYEA